MSNQIHEDFTPMGFPMIFWIFETNPTCIFWLANLVPFNKGPFPSLLETPPEEVPLDVVDGFNNVFWEIKIIK